MTQEEAAECVRIYANQFSSKEKAARVLGVSATYLKDVLSGHLPPGPKICEKLGMRKVVVYERIV